MSRPSFVDFVQRVLGVQLYPAQRVASMVAFDGAQPRDLSGDDRDLARTMFGPIDVVPDRARDVVAAVIGGGAGKSYVLGGLRLVHLGLTHRLDTLAPGQTGYGLIVAPDKALGRQTLGYIRGALAPLPGMTERFITNDKDTLSLRRPGDNKLIAFVVLAATRGGSAVRGRRYFGVFLDEAAFFYSDDGYSVTDTAIFEAASPRVLDGGQAIVSSTPWLESGIIYDLFRRNHGNPSCAIEGEVQPGAPTDALAVWAPTTLFNASPKVQRAAAAQYERDPHTAERELGARWVTRGAGLMFDVVAIKKCTSTYEAMLPPGPTAFAAVDPAFSSDAFGGAIVHVEDGQVRTAELFELRPEKGSPLKPSAAVTAFAERALAHGCRDVYTDVHYKESIVEHAEAAGLSVQTIPGGAGGKEVTHVAVRDALLEGRVDLSTQHELVIRQLGAIRCKPRQGGGLQITTPRRKGRHGDVASAWIAAVWAALDDIAAGASDGAATIIRPAHWDNGTIAPAPNCNQARPAPPDAIAVCRFGSTTFYTDQKTGERRMLTND